jgi:CheY-like chemotaxis protein
VVRDCIEAADNITLCVQHQRLIVDDILTVSKLDSGLLKVTPIPVQPILVINRATSMFKAEVQVKDMELRFDPQRSLDELNVDWVNMDPSRILQITVNLITNAIKFTQNSETEKRITVHLGASTEQPVPHDGGFEYIPTRSAPVDPTTAADWGDGQPLYLLIEVEDTGCGLTEKEKRVLFGRFAQASARTHAQYGGSGLGLFISRQLAELHGGQIGVSSQAGVGSTFGYCVKVRRASAAARPAILGPAPTPSRSSQPVRNAMEPDRRAIPSPANIATKPPERATAPTPATNAVKPPAAPAANKADNEADLHILIVEDNLVNQKVLSRQLRKAGCTVYTADNGLLALGHLATTSFCNPTGTKLSVILCDLEMPEMDGLTCVGRIREMEKSGAITGHVPVIAVSNVPVRTAYETLLTSYLNVVGHSQCEGGADQRRFAGWHGRRPTEAVSHPGGVCED